MGRAGTKLQRFVGSVACSTIPLSYVLTGKLQKPQYLSWIMHSLTSPGTYPTPPEYWANITWMWLNHQKKPTIRRATDQCMSRNTKVFYFPTLLYKCHQPDYREFMHIHSLKDNLSAKTSNYSKSIFAGVRLDSSADKSDIGTYSRPTPNWCLIKFPTDTVRDDIPLFFD